MFFVVALILSFLQGMFWGQLFGFKGLFISLPIAVILGIVGSYLDVTNGVYRR